MAPAYPGSEATRAGMESDEALMASYIAGDQRAFEALFHRYHPMLLRLMRRRGASASEANDLVQQTFLQLHRARNDFRRDARVRPYLMTIALNVHRGTLRRRGRHPEEALHADESFEVVDPKELRDTVVAEEDAARVRHALAELPESQRRVIELHWFDELPFKEVARVVGASLSAVKVRAFRGYGKLRSSLDEEVRS